MTERVIIVGHMPKGYRQLIAEIGEDMARKVDADELDRLMRLEVKRVEPLPDLDVRRMGKGERRRRKKERGW